MSTASSIRLTKDWPVLAFSLALMLIGWVLYTISRIFNFILTFFILGSIILILWGGIILNDKWLVDWVRENRALWGYRIRYITFMFAAFTIIIAYIGALLAYFITRWFLGLPNPSAAIPTLIAYLITAFLPYYYFILQPYLNIMKAYREVKNSISEILLYNDFIQIKGQGDVVRIPVKDVVVCANDYQGRYSIAKLSYASNTYMLIAVKGIVQDFITTLKNLNAASYKCS